MKISIIVYFFYIFSAYAEQHNNAFYQKVAYQYAPFIYTFKDPIDWIVSMDYDGDWDLTNNTSEARLLANKDRAFSNVTIYYDVVETSNYYLISYMPYHIANEEITNGHAHDSKSIVVLAKKETGNANNVVFFATNVHDHACNVSGPKRSLLAEKIQLPDPLPITLYYRSILADNYTSYGLPKYISPNNFAIDDVSIGSYKYFYSEHPLVYIVHRSHSIYPMNKEMTIDERYAGKLMNYLPLTTLISGNLPSSAYKNPSVIPYRLLSLSTVIVEHGLRKNHSSITVDPNSLFTANEYYTASEDAVADADFYSPLIKYNFNYFFNDRFFSKNKGLMIWQKSNEKAAIMPTHFAQPVNEEMPEAALPLKFANGDIRMMIEPIKFLDSIGIKGEKLLHSPYDKLPTLENFDLKRL